MENWNITIIDETVEKSGYNSQLNNKTSFESRRNNKLDSMNFGVEIYNS